MSSFNKNFIPRRIHKERSQPAARVAKHGLLEKKKDYKVRAKDHNKKMARLKILKEKAAFRNPDEFYFSMMNSSTKEGVIRRAVDKSLKEAIPLEHRTRDQRLLAESQDSRYVSYKLSLERGRVDALTKGLHFIDAAQATRRKHIIFVDNEEEADEVVAQRSRGSPDEEKEESENYKPVSKKLRKKQEKAYKLLAQHTDRQQKLRTVFEDMSVEKKLLSKGRRTLVRAPDHESGAPPVFRWAQERKR